MKIFSFLFLLVLTGVMGNAQGTFRIFGKIQGIQEGRAMLRYQQNGQQKQMPAEIKKGMFFFNGTLPEPEKLTILLTGDQFNGEIDFFSGNDIVSVQADTADLKNPLVSGSVSQKEFEKYRLWIIPVDEKSDALNRAGSQLYLSGKLDERIKDSLFAVRDQLDSLKKAVITRFSRSYPASPVSAWAISVFYGYDPDPDELVPLFNNLSFENRQGIYGKAIKQIIEAAIKTQPGHNAIDFTAKDVNNLPVKLSAYSGKFVLVDFWASWCGPCRSENPNVVRLYRKYHSDKFDILGFSLDNNKEQWLKAIEKDNLRWTQVSDLKAWDSKIISEYGIKGIPFNILLDKKGKIIAKNLRGAELEKKLEEIFN